MCIISVFKKIILNLSKSSYSYNENRKMFSSSNNNTNNESSVANVFRLHLKVLAAIVATTTITTILLIILIKASQFF